MVLVYADVLAEPGFCGIQIGVICLHCKTFPWALLFFFFLGLVTIFLPLPPKCRIIDVHLCACFILK